MKILLCIDQSRASKEAVKYAGKIAYATDSSITLLNVIKCQLPEVGPIEQYNRREAEEILSNAEKMLEDISLEKKIRRGNVEREILKESEDHDLVILGSHGVKGLELFLFKATSYKLVEKIDKPVLVVKKSREKISRVMLCISDSKYSRNAVEYAGQLCKNIGANAVLVHVKNKYSKEIIEEGKEILEEKGIEFDSLILEGKPSKAIIEEARIGDYDLIVLGTHGMPPSRMFFTGSVVYDVLKKSQVPGLIVK